MLLLSLLKCNTIIKLNRETSLQSVPSLNFTARIFFFSLTEVVVITLAQTGKTPAEESSCVFISTKTKRTAHSIRNHSNQATTHSIQPQLASAQQQAMCLWVYNSFFVSGKRRKGSRYATQLTDKINLIERDDLSHSPDIFSGLQRITFILQKPLSLLRCSEVMFVKVIEL